MKTQLKRILSVFLSMTLVWNLVPMQALATETDPAFSTRGSYSYQQVTDHRVLNTGEFVYRDDCFMRSSHLGCNHLLELSAEFAQAAASYFDANDNYGQDPSQCNKNVLGFFEAAGFKDPETNAYYTQMDGENSLSVAVAHREIDGFGKKYTLLAIAPKGVEYRQEWAGNFNVGTDMLHEGFKAARDEALRFTKSYIQKHGISGDLKVWISGYSRSAAVANLLGGFFADGGDAYFDDVTVEPENVYCYAFATPRNLIAIDQKTGEGLSRSKVLSVAPNRPDYPYDTPMASYVSSATGQVNPTAATFGGIRNYVATGDLFAMLPPAAWGYTVYGTTFTPGEDVHTDEVVTDEARMAQKLEGINKSMYEQFMNQGNESGFSWLSFDLASLALVTIQAPAGIEKTQQAFLRERVKGLKKVADDPDVFFGSGMSRAMSAALANYGFYVIYSRGATGAEQLQASKLIKPVLSTYFAYASERIIEESAAAGKALSEDEAAIIALADLITYVTGTPINAETSTTDDVMAALFKYLYDNKDSTLVTTLLGALDNLSDTNKMLVMNLLGQFCTAQDPTIEQVVTSFVGACAYGSEEGSSAYESDIRTPEQVRASIYNLLVIFGSFLNMPIKISDLLGADGRGNVVLKDIAGPLTTLVKSYKDGDGSWKAYDTLGDAADAFLGELADLVLGQAIAQCREQHLYDEDYVAAWQQQLEALKVRISSVRRCLSHFLFYSEGEPFSTGSIVRNVATLAGNGNRLITTHTLEIYTAWAQAVNAAENEKSDHFIRHVEGTPATVEGSGPYDCLEVHDVDGVDYYVSVSARKDWVDFDTTTRKDVTFELMRSVDGGAPVSAGAEEKTISADKTTAEDRTVTWNWLPREDEGGRRYVYSVAEKEGVDGYDPAPAKVLDNGTVVIANVEDVEVKVAVQWDDAGDAEGLRPDAITVRLVDEAGKVLTNIDGKECELVLLESGGWQGSFEKVPLVDEAGHSIRCRPDVHVDGYTTEVAGTAEDGFTVTLRHAPTTSLTVTKEWVGRIAGPVTVILTANGVDTNTSRVIEGNGSVTFGDLPAFDKDGKPIHYSAREVEGVYPNVKVTYPTPVDSRHMTIVNTNESKKTISGNIYWVGDRNVSLMSETTNQTVTTNAAPETQQPVSDVVESTPTDTGAVVTDTTGQQVGATGETEGVVAGDAQDPSVTVPGNEVVNGTESEEPGNVGDSQNEGVVAAVASALVRTAYADDLSGMVVQAAPSVRPTSVKLTLYANGEAVDTMTVTDPTGDSDVWPYSFGERPEFDTEGNEIVYQVVEGNVENYLKSGPGTSANGLNITNTYKPNSTSVTALVAWQDEANKDGKRPDSIRVQVYANGAPGEVRTLSAANSWTDTFQDLPTTDAYGNPITYTVRLVDAPANYSLDTTGDASSAFVFVEKYDHETTTVAGKVVWSDSDNAKGSRPSSVTVNLLVGDKVVESKKVTGSGNEWPFAFTGLDAYKDGKPITYTVGAGEVSGYTSNVTGSMATGFTITYTIKSGGGGGGTDPTPVDPSGHYVPSGARPSWFQYPPTFGGRRDYGSTYAPTTTTTRTTTSTNSGSSSYTNAPANSGYTIPSNTMFSSTTPTTTTSPVTSVTQAPVQVSAATPEADVSEGEGLAVTADATEVLWIYVLGLMGAAALIVSRRLRA